MSVCPFFSFAEHFEGLGLVANVGVSTTATPAAPPAPIPAVFSALAFAIFTAFIFTVPYVPISVLPTAPIITGLGELSLPLFLSSSSSFFPFFF